jgi:hypothetical protein
VEKAERKKMTIDLQPFCADSQWNAGGRHDMTIPWFENGWVYATDGRILVRHQSEPRPLRDNTPDAASLFRDFDPAKCTEELPQWDGSQYLYWESCEARQCHSGKISGGKNDCEECGGTGGSTESMPTTVEFRGWNFGGAYFQKIHTLPNPRGIIHLGDHSSGHRSVATAQLHFTFDDGGQGMVMNYRGKITTKGMD